MSNCIHFVRKNHVHFKKSEIDSAALANLIGEAEERINHKNRVADVDAETRRLQMLWWFLSTNVDFSPRGCVDIYFGEGRSGHTWRDFRGTLRILSQFVKADKLHYFALTDEYDGHRQAFCIQVNLNTAEIKDS